MLQTKGLVKYHSNYAIAYIDQDIVDYYLSLIPPYLYVNRGRYDAHLTIVRKDIELPNYDNWGYRNNDIITIDYDPVVYTDGTYYWLDAKSLDCVDIRKNLGLPGFRDGFDCYHITIGNTKGIQ